MLCACGYPLFWTLQKISGTLSMSLSVSRISDKIPPAECRFNIKKCCEYLRRKILISDLDEGKGFYVDLTCEERKYTRLRKKPL